MKVRISLATRNAERKGSCMSTEKRDIDGMGVSASVQGANEEQLITEKNLKKSIRRGISTPYARVLLRVALSLLLVSSIGLFATGVMKYSELQREKQVLEEQKEALATEIEELKYLVDHPVDRDYIIRMAREKLGLNLPGEIVYYNDTNDKK